MICIYDYSELEMTREFQVIDCQAGMDCIVTQFQCPECDGTKLSFTRWEAFQ